MKFRFIAILSAILLLYTALNYYIGWNGIVFLRHAFQLKITWIYWVCFWIVAYSYIISRLAARFLNTFTVSFLKIIGSFWFAIVVYTLILFPAADLLVWILNFSTVQHLHDIPAIGYAAFALLALILWRGSWNARSPIIRTYSITIHKAAGSYKELRIAVASDLHLGTVVGIRHLKKLVERIHSLQPDLILLPGDIIDDDVEPYRTKRMSEIMKQLQADLGVYAILGNHEYIGGQIQEFAEQMKASHVNLLMDETVKIADSFYLIGRKDRAVTRMGKGTRLELDALLADLDNSLPLILMDHQPYQFDIAESKGIDLLLCGHTHRGQMAPFHRITKRLFELDWGYLLKGGMHVLVSSGFGSWGPPIRLGSRSELIELVVKFEPAESRVADEDDSVINHQKNKNGSTPNRPIGVNRIR